MNMDTALPQEIEQQPSQGMLACQIEIEPARESLDPRAQPMDAEQVVQLRDQCRRTGGHTRMQCSTLLLEVLENGPGGRQRQRMANEGTGKECHPDARRGVVAIAPHAAV